VKADWAPALNVSLSFRFDGLSTLFAVLITAVGPVVVVSAAKYLEPGAQTWHVRVCVHRGRCSVKP
jgi:NADH:ubiquinone oxidoreductase subunit 5 (subunit L)/multisubunit Na+/H+ antiporter MnhA subunit